MARFVLMRLGDAFLQLLFVGTLIFFFVRLMPGDPAMLVAGPEKSADPVVVAAVRTELGLDRPLLLQYAGWVRGLAAGDLGRSLMDNRPVAQDLLDRTPRTLELVGVTTFLAALLGIPLGVIAALRRNRPGDGLLSGLAAAGISVPVYVIGTVFVLVFGLYLRWFPASGYAIFSTAPGEHLRKLVLPSLTLAFGMAANIVRMTRSSVLEVARKDYVRTAAAKGLHPRTVIFKHVLRNALSPVITVIGLQMGSLLGGTVLVEYIFNWPGLSILLLNGVNRRDYPMVQGVVLLTSILFIVINLGVDLLYAALNPRIRYE